MNLIDQFILKNIFLTSSKCLSVQIERKKNEKESTFGFEIIFVN